MPKPYGEINRPDDAKGDMAIMAADRQGRRIVLDLEDVRRRCEALYSAWDKNVVVPKMELTADQVELLRAKMEARGFDRLVWVRGAEGLPGARTIIEKAIIDKNGPAPEFFGRATVENIDGLKEERPAGSYLLLTKGDGAESWTRGKSAEEVQALLRRLGECGLTLREYLLLDNAADPARAGGRTPASSPRIIGEYLPGSVLPEGGIIAVSRGAAGDLSITSADPDQKHPDFGARGALIIPL